MNEIELQQMITHALSKSNLQECISVIANFQASGGEQQVAYDVILDLSSNDELDSDLVYDVMDIISGWCSPHRRIWDSPLKNGLLLFRVSETEERDGNIALLPGVSQSLIANCQLGKVRQGTMVELRPPNGKRLTTPITNYFIKVPSEPDEQFDVSDAPVVICVSSEIPVSAGMEVWIRY